MQPSQLRAFHAVAQTGSFTKAAEALNVSQPAVSDHVRKLELAYGTPLFIRHARGIQLTEIGRRLFALSERSAEMEHEMLALLSQAKKLEVGHLVIGADAAAHVIPLLKLLKTRYPGVGVRLVRGNSTKLVERLHAFEIDFAVVSRVPDKGDLAAIQLSVDPVVAVVSARSDLAKKKSLSLKELAKHPMVMRESGSFTRDLVFEAFQKRGLDWQIALEVEGREACFEAVAEGLGPAIVSAGELPQDTRLKALPISEKMEPMGEWLVYLQARSNLRLVQALVDVAREVGARPR